MKAIILSAGQGRRLLPLTTNLPKCLVTVQGKSLLEWQIGELHKCGIEQITVVTGYRRDKVDELLSGQPRLQRVQAKYNPEYDTADNLVSCWSVRDEMAEDFVLLNGDTLFEAPVLKRLLASPGAPITVTINQKEHYDDDDMKVSLAGSRLVRIGKKLSPSQTQGESIGMILFRGQGPEIFKSELVEARSDPRVSGRWYLSVIDTIARKREVQTCCITGLLWCEVDCPADLQDATRVVAGFGASPLSGAGSGAARLSADATV
ncbi:MAG: sugar phosphate nucleotidyltransferase [Desulfopila sp.]